MGSTATELAMLVQYLQGTINEIVTEAGRMSDRRFLKQRREWGYHKHSA